jgi:hypothetical protein
MRSFELRSHPRLVSRSTIRVFGRFPANRRTTSSVSSVDRSSPMRTSRWGQVWAARLSRVRVMKAAPL